MMAPIKIKVSESGNDLLYQFDLNQVIKCPRCGDEVVLNAMSVAEHNGNWYALCRNCMKIFALDEPNVLNQTKYKITGGFEYLNT